MNLLALFMENLGFRYPIEFPKNRVLGGGYIQGIESRARAGSSGRLNGSDTLGVSTLILRNPWEDNCYFLYYNS